MQKKKSFIRKGKRVCLTDNGRGRVRLNDFDSTGYLLRGVEEAFAQCPDYTKV